jgi:hypothetical protein
MIKSEVKIKEEPKKEEPIIPQNTPEVVNSTAYGVVMYKDNNSYAVIVNKQVKEIYTGADAFNIAAKSFAQNYKP